MVVAMNYLVEIYDSRGCRIASYDEVPLLDAVQAGPDRSHEIRGLLPRDVEDLGHAYRIRVLVDGAHFCEGLVDLTKPQWGDAKKLILERYVPFHEVIEFEAHSPERNGNTTVSRAYKNREIGAIVKDAINSAKGSIHYWVDHSSYPEGAEREYAKFLARKTDDNELGVGDITTGQWVGSDRIDLSAAYAKDGDTIAGVKVDGAAWPDIRMMLIDCEETSWNWHGVSRHPEIVDWSSEQYAASGYKRKADAATAFLQQLITSNGIDYIELNPHKDAAGEYDDRVDAYGRYLALVYGGGECYNAGLVEQELADIYLYGGGTYHVPEMALKDFFSYVGTHEDSVETTGVSLAEFDVSGGVLEVLTALAYAGGGYVFSVDDSLGVVFRLADKVDRVLFYDARVMGVQLGSSSESMRNLVYFDGNPFTGTVNKTYACGESIDEYGYQGRGFEYFSISMETDADKLAGGMLDDLAYPERLGKVAFFAGDAAIRVGDVVELRDGPLRRFERELPGEWGGRFTGRLVGRVSKVQQRFMGKHVLTTAFLTSPLRSVSNPLSFMTRSQEAASTLFEFRLDDATVGLDMGFHLD